MFIDDNVFPAEFSEYVVMTRETNGTLGRWVRIFTHMPMIGWPGN